MFTCSGIMGNEWLRRCNATALHYCIWTSCVRPFIFAALKKLIAILLLMIVGLTTFTQCCIDDNCAQELAMGTTSHSENGGDEGACSPFSSCTTCSGFTTQVPCVQVAAPAASQPLHQSIEAPLSLPLVSFAFWQPPRAVAITC